VAMHSTERVKAATAARALFRLTVISVFPFRVSPGPSGIPKGLHGPCQTQELA
jgi:hypothetical protein